MNQEIKQLMLEAGIEDNPDQQGLELFAELIVRQCAEIADVETSNSIGCGYITKTKGMKIKEHFGVELQC
jgi:hypothetical protein